MLMMIMSTTASVLTPLAAAIMSSSVRSAPSLLQFRRDLKTALHVSVIVLFTGGVGGVAQW